MVSFDVEKAEQMAKLRKLWSLLEDGRGEEEIRKEMNLDPESFDELRKKVLESEADKFRKKSVGEMFMEYVLHQKQVIHDLNQLSRQVVSSRQPSAAVTALKAKSEIYDKIIERGQEFGIIEKKPERREIVAGIMVAKMDDDQLRGAIVGELVNLEGMMRDFGGKGIIDIEPGPIHRALPEPVSIDKETVKGHKSKANRVFSGRRVVKGGPFDD